MQNYWQNDTQYLSTEKVSDLWEKRTYAPSYTHNPHQKVWLTNNEFCIEGTNVL